MGATAIIKIIFFTVQNIIMRNYITFFLFLFTASAVYMIGCKKMDDKYRQFVENGETVYVAKADSLEAHSGKKRVELTWLLLSDPKVKSYKVYWDSRKDSLEGTVQKTDNVDTVRVMVNDLEEGIHYFEVYMFGKDGNMSVQSTAIGYSYDAIYQGSLLPRIIKNADWGDNNSIHFDLTPAGNDAYRTEIEYTDKDKNSIVTHFVSRDIDEDTVLRVKNKTGGAPLKYRTVFLPDSTAIDTFYSNYTTINVIKRPQELDKSEFSLLELDNDNWQSHYSTRSPDLMWDGSTSSSPYATEMPDQFPSSFSIDLGEEAELTKFRWNDYSGGKDYAYFYNRGTPVHFEAWGSNNPGTDGDWADWTQLGTYEIKKPSGSTSAKDDLTQADIDYGIAGYEFSFDSTKDNTYRYIRFKVYDVWQGKDPYYVWIGELTFWGMP